MGRLTKRQLAAAEPRAKVYELRCDALPNFRVRVLPGGTKTACIRYAMPDGSRRRMSLGAIGPAFTLDQARKLATKMLSQVAQGLDPSTERREGRAAPTVKDAADRYMDEHSRVHNKPRTVQGYEILLRRHILPKLGRLKIASLTRVKVEGLHRQIGESHPGAANRALALLRAICAKSELWEYRAQNSNPCRGVRRFREEPKDRFLSGEERQRLEAVLIAGEQAPHRRRGYVGRGTVLAIRMLSLTGMRLGEVLGLTWNMVDVENACLRLPDSKTGRRIIPISRPTLAILRAARKRGMASIFVCPNERGAQIQNIQRTWARVRRDAGIDGVRIHDLRHSAASDALMAGVPLALVGAMLGHKDTRTTQRYAHIADSVVREAVERAGGAIVIATKGLSS